MFVLAAADDEVVAVPQATAVKSLCTGTSVEIRVESGRHLSLFMGWRTLDTAWRDVASWLTRAGTAAASPSAAAHSHRFVRKIQAPLREQIFDVAIAEREANIEPNRVPDDRRWELPAGKRDRHAPSDPPN
jgi:hypothetical protein